MTDQQTISWIFLATALASKNQPANDDSISRIADGINHAVPTREELRQSFAWLMKYGLVISNDGKYSLTEKGISEFKEASKNTPMAFGIWDNLEITLMKYEE